MEEHTHLLEQAMDHDRDQDEYDYADGELTAIERRRLRRIIESDRRARWFWATSRTWIIWIGGVALAITSTYGWLKDVIKALSR